MKLLLPFCLLVVFIFAEASALPTPQVMDFLEKAKERVQEAFDQAQNAATNALQTAKDALQSGMNSAQQAVQSEFGLGEFSKQNGATTTSKIPAAA